MIISKLRIICEVDGEQHYQEHSFFKGTLDERKARDKYKEEKAIENGFSVIRVDQMDVLLSRNKWEKQLLDAIEAIKGEDPCVMTLY